MKSWMREVASCIAAILSCGRRQRVRCHDVSFDAEPKQPSQPFSTLPTDGPGVTHRSLRCRPRWLPQVQRLPFLRALTVPLSTRLRLLRHAQCVRPRGLDTFENAEEHRRPDAVLCGHRARPSGARPLTGDVPQHNLCCGIGIPYRQMSSLTSRIILMHSSD